MLEVNDGNVVELLTPCIDGVKTPSKKKMIDCSITFVDR
jgi:hypothetical protein